MSENKFYTLREKVQSYFKNDSGDITGIKKGVYITLKVIAAYVVTVAIVKTIGLVLPRPWNAFIGIYFFILILNWKNVLKAISSAVKPTEILKENWKSLTLPLIFATLFMFVYDGQNEQDKKEKAMLKQLNASNSNIEKVIGKLQKEIDERKARCSPLNLDMNITETCLRRNTNIYKVNYLGVSKCLEKQKVWSDQMRVKHCVEDRYWGNGPKDVDVKQVFQCLKEFGED